MQLPPFFNPSNDMALAANVRQYFPPRRIQQMESDLASLARFWDEGPWGWSLATREHYLRMGIPSSFLPSDDYLAELRHLSSRQFGVEYYKALLASLPESVFLPCQARCCTALDEVEPPIILKSLWSSSGRGNIVVEGSPDASTLLRVKRILREQGGIVVEPFYADKVLDFAMEFDVSDDGVRFLGYSVFEADGVGHYGGNYVESQESLLRRIALPSDLLARLVSHHQSALAALPYRGPVGIDMMRLSDGRVHPCVEVNFRMTMGLLALLLYKKGIRDDQFLTPPRPEGFTARIHHSKLMIKA